MIFDRTAEDISTAISVRSEKLQKGISLTEEDIQALERGFLTINTLNRIESKQDEQQKKLNDMAYIVSLFSSKVWDATQIYSQVEFDRVLENLEKLKQAFYTLKETPAIPDRNYRRYDTINAVEKILNDIDVVIADIISHYRQCGDISCGE